MTAISTQQTKRPSNKWRQILTLQAAVFLIAACGQTDSQTGTPQPTPTASPTAVVTPLPVIGSTLYTSSDSVYSIRYPSTWRLDPSAPFFIAYPPEVCRPCSVVIPGVSMRAGAFLIYPSDHINRSDYVSSDIAVLGSHADFTNIQAAIDANAVTLGKNTWVRIKDSYYDGNVKLPVAEHLYIADHGEKTYAIWCQAIPAKVLDQFDDDYCKPMLATLTFLQ